MADKTILTVYLLFYLLRVEGVLTDELPSRYDVHEYSAVINITYTDPRTGIRHSEREESGKYGVRSRYEDESGIIVHVRSKDNTSTGCSPIINPAAEKWIALIQRGGCKFHNKILNAVHRSNASAVVIYNDKTDSSVNLVKMSHEVDDVVNVFINEENGKRLAGLVDNGTRVMMHISLGSEALPRMSTLNRTSVLFVSISFIVLMIISLAWLVFYYIQRFRYAHAKERLSKRLMNAARKAIAKMPTRTLKPGDAELSGEDGDQCAVCIEQYQVSEVLRMLPCKHGFHKLCIDPWLLEQRSCPVCKADILKAYGMQVNCEHHCPRESEIIEAEAGSTSLSNGLSTSDPVWMYASPHGHSDVETVRFHQVDFHGGFDNIRPMSVTMVPIQVVNPVPADSRSPPDASAGAPVTSQSEGAEAAPRRTVSWWRRPLRKLPPRGAAEARGDHVRSCPDELHRLMPAERAAGAQQPAAQPPGPPQGSVENSCDF